MYIICKEYKNKNIVNLESKQKQIQIKQKQL